ncbi:uncharacterized protein LOC114963633 [Acropora millepora]|uniref:uncharacterized protein LOC114963633 n=1 Tax=Acropora millepora TaxID=45264 RepID=UPI001CF4FD6B|nr:uncharacterized protein LOC114963633 [Acropora millepora]
MISASSELNKNHTVKDGRISYLTDQRSAWCAGPEFSLGTQYLQVDFNESVLVSAVATQGDATDNHWINRYLVHYSWNGFNWIVATDSEGKVKEFNGNTDGSSVVRHWLKPRFNARYVRFVPILWTGQLCMRVEIYGCKATVFPSAETITKTLTKEPQTCVKHNCTHIPHSMCFMYSGKRHCKCIQTCTSEQAKVCGSDGRTYRNECHLKRTACVNKKNVDVLKHGPCPVKLAGKDCRLPLGLEDGRISDDMISASSEMNKNHTAKDGRISNTMDQRSAWCAGPEFGLGTQYLQVDFNESVLVSAVATQGDATDNNWVIRYLVHYSWNGSDWIVATDSEGKVKEFNGNTDGSSVVRHWLKPRFNARYVRFVPILWTGELCMRVEIYGCKATVFPSVETITKTLTKVSTSCDKECLTPPHSHCVIRNETSQTCECTKHCPKMHIPVCGSDEKVYVNYCLLRKTACETNTTIKIIRHGHCTTTKLSAKKKLAKPRCNDESCPPYAKCNDTDSEIQCTCPNCSSHTGKKVCGSNGKMYIDSCDLRKHSCKENIMVTEAKHGCAVIERVAVMRRNKTQTQVKTKKEKPINIFKTFYISMAFVGGLGVAIGLGMCICRPLKSKKESGKGRSVDHHRDKSVESI